MKHAACILSLIVLVTGLGLSAQANTDRWPASGESPKFSTQFGPGINFITQGAATTNRTTVFNMLLGSTAGTPNWPAYPRLWYEEFDLATMTSNTYWHPKLAALNGGIEIEYKYGMKTTLVMITSAVAPDSENSNPDAQKIIDEPSYEVVKWDPTTHRNYPYVRPGIPMVGFCSFELNLVTSKGQSGGVEMFGAGTKLERTTAHGVTYTIFSKFFPIPADVAVTDLFQTYCKNEFQKSVRVQAEKNFLPVIIEQTILKNPNSSCKPSAQDNDDGDVACQRWFKEFDIFHRRGNVARCELQRNGASVCKLKAKKSVSCPLYTDSTKKIYTDPPRDHNVYQITKTDLPFPCDRGLTCTMTKAPVNKAWGLISILGEASCR